jgi:hypothetical protein
MQIIGLNHLIPAAPEFDEINNAIPHIVLCTLHRWQIQADLADVAAFSEVVHELSHCF